MNIYFKLRKPANKKTGKCQVQVFYVHGGKAPLRLNTNIHTKSSNWDKVKEQLIIDEVFNDKLTANDKLTILRKDLQKVADAFWEQNGHANNYPLPLVLKGLYARKDDPAPPATNLLLSKFKEWYEGLIADDKRVYKTLYFNLEYVFGNTFTLDQVTPETLTKLRQYWLEIKNANDTIRKRWGILNRFLKAMGEEVNPKWLRFELGIKGNDRSENIFMLTEDEFEALSKYDLKSKFSSEEIHSVHLFILSCLTSLRISDVRKVHPDLLFPDKNGIKRLKIEITKNRNKQKNIPLTESALELIALMDWTVRKMAEQEIRANIHHVFEEIASDMPDTWREELQYYKMSGSKELHRNEPKYKFLNFHSSRKTFCTIYSRKIPADQLKVLGGWKNFATMDRYITPREDPKFIKKYVKL